LLAGERTRRRVEEAQRARQALRREPAKIAGASPQADEEEASLRTAWRGPRSREELAEAYESDVRISRLPYRDGLYVGLLQILALLPGVSRSGVTMVGGLWRGLDHEDAARFAFLLATPVILAAGVLKLPSLAGHAGAHIHGQVAVGFVLCGAAAY